jgi:hypothetical protein
VLQKVVNMLEFLQKIVEFFAATDYKNEIVAAIPNTLMKKKNFCRHLKKK